MCCFALYEWILSSTGNFTHSIKGKSRILSHNHCEELQTVETLYHNNNNILTSWNLNTSRLLVFLLVRCWMIFTASFTSALVNLSLPSCRFRMTLRPLTKRSSAPVTRLSTSMRHNSDRTWGKEKYMYTELAKIQYKAPCELGSLPNSLHVTVHKHGMCLRWHQGFQQKQPTSKFHLFLPKPPLPTFQQNKIEP